MGGLNKVVQRKTTTSTFLAQNNYDLQNNQQATMQPKKTAILIVNGMAKAAK